MATTVFISGLGSLAVTKWVLWKVTDAPGAKLDAPAFIAVWVRSVGILLITSTTLFKIRLGESAELVLVIT